jgi:hypothetical protein
MSEPEVFPQTNWVVGKPPTTFEFKGLVEVDFHPGVVYCVIDINEAEGKQRYMSLSYVFEKYFKGVMPELRTGNKYENVTITIKQEPHP